MSMLKMTKVVRASGGTLSTSPCPPLCLNTAAGSVVARLVGVDFAAFRQLSEPL